MMYRGVVAAVLISSFSAATLLAQPATKPQPDARTGNWLFKTPDPKVWKRTEKNGDVIFSADEPPGDFCTLTLFGGATADGDFTTQFNAAVAADQKAKDTQKIEADSGAKASKSQEGFDVLTRSIRAETSTMHSWHMYVAGNSGNRFDMAAFQTSSETSWKYYGAQASQFLASLKLANSLPAAEVQRLAGNAAPADDAPTLPGFGDPVAPAGNTPATPTPAAVAATPTPAAAPRAFAPVNIPAVPLENSPIVQNHAVLQNGKPVNGVKLSQHDTDISNPCIAVGSDGVIHVAFIEQHKTTYKYAVYYRSSADGGKTWTEAKNMTEDMPGIAVGRCQLEVDSHNRVYVIWRAAMKESLSADTEATAARDCNIWYRILSNGAWSRAKLAAPAGDAERQADGTWSYFATVDASGKVQVIWNSRPDKWHPELTHVSGTYTQSLSGVGNGLVFQATLDGTSASAPREIFLPEVRGLGEQGGYGAYCDGLDTLEGYADSTGAAHFIAFVKSNHDPISGKSCYEIVENGKAGQKLDVPDMSYHEWRDVPKLLVDAAGKQHIITMYNGGERPSIRDYVVGSDEEPTVIRAVAPVKGTLDGFQAYQGPGGRMIAVMEMNDTGDRANGETYVSISTGKGWSTPVNVTNNAGRRSFASKQTSPHSNVAIEKSYYPGPGAATIDRQGHLLMVMVNNEYGLFSNSAFGVELMGGSSSTPILQFIKF